MTIPEFLSGHWLWPLIPGCKCFSWWPLQYRVAGQSWPPSCTFQRSCSLPQECNSALFWWSHGHVPHGLMAVANLLNWVSNQGPPLPRLQEAHTLFLYFLWVILMVTSSVSKKEKQSPEADSISESPMFSVDASKWDEAQLWLASLSLSWCPVLFKVPTTVPCQDQWYWDWKGD